MDVLASLRRCNICKDRRPKDSAKIILEAADGKKILRVCSKCEKILELSNRAAHGDHDEREN
jgi:hypothetical protein